MRRLLTTLDIEAPAARVWDILTDFPRYPDWNPYISRVEGELVPLRRLRVTTPPVLARPHSFRPTLLDVDPGAKFRWAYIILSPRLFRGEHFFALESVDPGSTRLVHGESFSGLLTPLYMILRYHSTKREFERMNARLKQRVESLSQQAR